MRNPFRSADWFSLCDRKFDSARPLLAAGSRRAACPAMSKLIVSIACPPRSENVVNAHIKPCQDRRRQPNVHYSPSASSTFTRNPSKTEDSNASPSFALGSEFVDCQAESDQAAYERDRVVSRAGEERRDGLGLSGLGRSPAPFSKSAAPSKTRPKTPSRFWDACPRAAALTLIQSRIYNSDKSRGNHGTDGGCPE